MTSSMRRKRRSGRGGRVLVTTLTKRMAEDLTEYLTENSMRVRYLHSEVDTLERIEIIRDLRLGAFDILVGINLLREGWIYLNARSSRSSMRIRKVSCAVAPRGADNRAGCRNVDGRVVLYADNMTGLPAICH